MPIKHRYILNLTNNKAYALNDIPFRKNTLYTRFAHSELKQLTEAQQQLINRDLLPDDVLVLETLSHGRERALYEVHEL